MNSKKADQFLPCYRAGQSDPGDSRIAKAVKVAGNDPVLKAKLEAQASFDSEAVEKIEKLEAPDSVLESMVTAEHPKARGANLRVFKQPAFLSVGFAFLVMLGVLFYFTYNHINRFAGQERVMELLDTTEEMSGVELEPKVTQLGKLGDWLFSKGFENYQIPPEFAAYKTVGCRVFKQNGARVAQIAVEPNDLIFFIFQPADFGVRMRSRDGWRTFEQDDWAGAVRVWEGACVMIAMRGDKDDIERVLASIPAKK